MFGSLTARENVLVAAEIRRSWARDRSIDPRREAMAILERVGIRAVADERVDALPTGLARLVELGRALATRPTVLLLDEPASGLDESESEDFAELLLELADEGMAILLVEHDVQLVMKVCSLIHVLDFGAILAVGHARRDPAGPDGARRLPRHTRRGRRVTAVEERPAPCRCSS